MSTRSFLAGLLLFGLGAASVQAQQSDPETDRSIVESTMNSVMKAMEEISFHNMRDALRDALQRITEQVDPAYDPAGVHPEEEVDNLDELAEALVRLRRQVHALREEARAREDRDAARVLDEVADELEELAEDVTALEKRVERRLARGETPHRSRHDYADHDDEAHDHEVHRDDDGELHVRRKEDRGDRHAGTPFLNDEERLYLFDWGSSRWPYPEEALYRPVPAVRYNRVEGLALGIGLRPLDFGSGDRSRIYGQIGYAFALDKRPWRYEIGLETRLGRRHGVRRSGLKIGGAYYRNTATNDLWKVDWMENSLAALLFKNDFLDYYEIAGWTAYAVQRLNPYSQLSVGFRGDRYRSLEGGTNWSLFKADPFRFNPPVEEGRMQSVLVALEGGRVAGLSSVPRGAILRAEAEFGQGLGGDFSFNRYVADGRVYVPTGGTTSLSLRARGGWASDTAPVQKAFTLGGPGSVRAYPQNAYAGTRMLLGNAEFSLGQVYLFDDVLEDLTFFTFADAGWTGAAARPTVRADEMLAAAGIGVALDERQARFELAWPLNGPARGPALWFRLSPTF